MAIEPCCLHHARYAGRAATSYWVWFAPDGERICFKLASCPDCHLEVLLGVLSQSQPGVVELDICPGCGTKFDPVPLPLFLTVYMPGTERRDYERPFCSACHSKVVSVPLEHGKRQPNRQVSPSPLIPSSHVRDWGLALPPT